MNQNFSFHMIHAAPLAVDVLLCLSQMRSDTLRIIFKNRVFFCSESVLFILSREPNFIQIEKIRETKLHFGRFCLAEHELSLQSMWVGLSREAG